MVNLTCAAYYNPALVFGSLAIDGAKRLPI